MERIYTVNGGNQNIATFHVITEIKCDFTNICVELSTCGVL